MAACPALFSPRACPSYPSPSPPPLKQGEGRSKKEAEQRAAYLALCRIADKAPELGAKPPPLPALLLGLSSGPSHLRSTASPSAPASSTSGLSWSEYETVPAPGSSIGAGSLRGTGGRSPAGAATSTAGRRAAVLPPAALHAIPSSGRPSDAEIYCMGAGQLRQELKAALQREARLPAVLGSVAAAAAEALG